MSQGNDRRRLRRGSVQLKASDSGVIVGGGRPSGIKPSKNMDEEIMLRSPKGGKKDGKRAKVDIKQTDIEQVGRN